MATTIYTDMEDDTQKWYNKVLLVRALPNLLHDRFGMQKPLPTKNTRKVLFRRWDALSVATTALTEGTTPAGSSLAKTEVNLTMAQYGDFVTVSDFLTWTSRDPVLTEAAAVLGEQAGQSIDQIYRDVLVAGTSTQFANGSARTDVNTIIEAADLNQVTRTLKVNNAKFFTKMMLGEDRVGSTPVRASFWAIVHPDVEFDLEGVTGFIGRAEYPGGMDAMDPFEIGAYKRNIRFVSTTHGKIFLGGGTSGGSSVKETTSNADIYATLVFGREAYATVPLSGHAMENIIKPLGSSGTADPLNQRATSGWKATTASVILNNNFMTRIESAASS